MFVKFKSISFVNYKGIKKSTLSLDNKYVVLIRGTNNDKPGSNGSGKSTIPNGLLWCLYDKTLAGKELEKEILPKFVNKTEFKKNKGCRVSVLFERENVEYRVIRYRKHPEYKNTVRLYRGQEDLTKCTDKETNNLIVEIVGADYHTFINSNIFSFSKVKPFLELSDKDKKELILPNYFVEKFKTAYKKCGDKIKKVDEKISLSDNEILTCNVKESEKKQVLAKIEEYIRLKNKQIEDSEIELLKLKGYAHTLSQNKLNKERELKKISSNISSIFNEKLENDRLMINEWGRKDDQLMNLTFRLNVINDNINSNKLHLSSVNNNIIDNIFNTLNKLKEEIKLNENLRLDLTEKIVIFNKDLKIKEEALQEVNNTKTTVKESIADTEKILTNLDKNNDILSSEIELIESQVDKIVKKFYNEQCKVCPHSKFKEWNLEKDEKIAKLNEEKQTLKSRIDPTLNKIKDLKLELKSIESIENVCNNDISDFKYSVGKTLNDELLVANIRSKELKIEFKKEQELFDKFKETLNSVERIKSIVEKLESEKSDLLVEMEKLEKEDPKGKIKLCEKLEEELSTKLNKLYEEEFIVKSKISEITCDIIQYDEQIKNIEHNLSIEDRLDQNREEIINELKKLKEYKDKTILKKDRYVKELDILNFWKIGFGPTGIEGFMLDNLIDNMNILISKYLGYLTNNTISLTIVPDTELKTGDKRNKVSEIIENEFGGNTYRTNSEGEKRVIDISILLALKYIYENISGTKYNVLFCDEVFDTLDAPTCSLVINLINSLNNIDSIFVMSHNESLALEFDNFIKVEKKKGVIEIDQGEES